MSDKYSDRTEYDFHEGPGMSGKKASSRRWGRGDTDHTQYEFQEGNFVTGKKASSRRYGPGQLDPMYSDRTEYEGGFLGKNFSARSNMSGPGAMGDMYSDRTEYEFQEGGFLTGQKQHSVRSSAKSVNATHMKTPDLVSIALGNTSYQGESIFSIRWQTWK